MSESAGTGELMAPRPRCPNCGRAARGLYAREGDDAIRTIVTDAANCRHCGSFLIPPHARRS